MTHDPNGDDGRDSVLDESVTSIGQYRFERLLHSGLVQRIFEAECRDQRAVVALLHPSLSHVSKVRQAYVEGLRFAAAVDHVAAVPVTECGVFDEQAYAVMPFIEGESLEELGARSRSLPVSRALRHARDVLGFLQIIHSLGLVHGGLSPRKVIATPSGATRVLGLGLGRVREHALRSSKGDLSTMDTAFVAPEQRAAGFADATPRSDLWSVGAITFALLAGVPPPSSASGRAAVRAKVRPISDYVPDVPAAVVRLLGRALAPDPEERFDDAGSMRAVFEDVMQFHGGFTVKRLSTEPPPSIPERAWERGADEPGSRRHARRSDSHVQKYAPSSQVQVTAPTVPSLRGGDLREQMARGAADLDESRPRRALERNPDERRRR